MCALRFTMMPSLTYNSMAAGCALLALCPHECDLARVVEEAECGVRCDPEDAEAIEEFLRRAADDSAWIRRFQENATRAAKEHYSPRNAALMVDRMEGREG